MSSTTAGLIQLGVLLLLLAAVYVPFGNYLAGVYSDGRHWRVERALYRVVRVDPDSEQRWTGYAAALLAFSFLSVVLLYLLQRLQGLLPLSLGRGAVEPGIAFNTAISFVTNTNWQSYVPETVMGHLVQMTGLTFNRVGPEQRESILEAGLALQKGGVIKPDVDVKKAVDDLIDGRFVTVTN